MEPKSDSSKRQQDALVSFTRSDSGNPIHTYNTDLEMGLTPANIDDRMRANGVPPCLVRNMRNAFVRKVYSILVIELLVTVGISAFCMLYAPVQQFCVAHRSAIIWGCFVPTVISLVALICYKQRYPINFVCLSIFVLLESWTIGVVCALYKENGSGWLILQAFGITLAIFLVLTLYTCQSKKDFSFMGGMLGVGLMSLIFWGFLNIWFGWHTTFLFSLCGALLFSGFIVYDTFLIMKKYDYGTLIIGKIVFYFLALTFSPPGLSDDYLIASVELYLDFLNLFLYILQLLGNSNND